MQESFAIKAQTWRLARIAATKKIRERGRIMVSVILYLDRTKEPVNGMKTYRATCQTKERNQ